MPRKVKLSDLVMPGRYAVIFFTPESTIKACKGLMAKEACRSNFTTLPRKTRSKAAIEKERSKHRDSVKFARSKRKHNGDSKDKGKERRRT